MTSKEKLLNKIRENTKRISDHYAVAPANFLEAWKEAVNKIGVAYFQCQSGYTIPIEASVATNKWQLCPNVEAMEVRFGTCSVGEGVFMAAILSFYNSQTSQPFMHDYGMYGIGDVANRLDLDEADIVTRLMLNHTGW